MAALGLTSVAQATQTTTLGISATSTKAGANSKLVVKYTNRTDQPVDTAPQQSHIVVWFPKGARTDFKDFPHCTVPLSGRPAANCGPARLGPGKVFNDARLDGNHNVLGSMNVYNGGGNVLYLPVVVTQPADVIVYVRGILTKVNSGPYGLRLDANFRIPVLIQGTQPPFINNFTIGPIGAIKRVRGRTVSFITNPSTCTSKGWGFRIDSSYIDGSRSSATTTVKCKK